MDMVGQLSGFDCIEDWAEDEFAKVIDGNGVGIGQAVEDDNISSGDVSEFAVVVGEGKRVFGFPVDDDHPLA